MNKIFEYKLNSRRKKYGEGCGLSLLGDEIGDEVRNFHSTIPGYAPTPLVRMDDLASRLNLGSINIKDESKRFGLNAFKSLGGSFAMAKYIAQKIGREVSSLSYEELTSSEVKGQVGDITFITATDGNHGRGVAWAAEKLGYKAIVFMPKGSSETRAQNIRNHGAECTITEFNYDDTVRLASQVSQELGGVLIQDTAWDGYEDIPTWIMQGYLTLAIESFEQLIASQAHLPTHIILQAGVGSFAGTVIGYFTEKMKDKAPVFMVVEPRKANCLYVSAVANDGNPHSVGGSMSTIMAGLACGEPNVVSWPINRDYTDCFFSAEDRVAANGMRILAAPTPGGDPAIVSGESGAVGIGLIYEVMSNSEHEFIRSSLHLNEHSHVLLISTEGDTSPDIYQEIVWFGRNS